MCLAHIKHAWHIEQMNFGLCAHAFHTYSKRVCIQKVSNAVYTGDYCMARIKYCSNELTYVCESVGGAA